MEKNIPRRAFLKETASAAAIALIGQNSTGCAVTGIAKQKDHQNKPNLIFVFADQWRAQDLGYAGNPQVQTPHLDRLAKESINLTNAVSGCPVCCPYRASLMTGQHPLTHGVFMNDVPLSNNAVSIAQAYNNAGYHTAYIGKWHLNGPERTAYTPRDKRQGFKFWQAMECTHEYNQSYYYADENVKLLWKGYDAIDQTEHAQKYIKEHAEKPFALFLSWGPPHEPYHTAPEQYRKIFENININLRPNIPEHDRRKARTDIAGYYAHMAALDDCMGKLLNTLKETRLEKNTILVFTSDHGDMLYSHGKTKKQQPWDESIKVPFLLRYPAVLGTHAKNIDTPIGTPDIMPTLLGLSNIEIPNTVEGNDYSPLLKGTGKIDNDAVIITCPAPFGQWQRAVGGKEYRGIRTRRYTYTRDLNGPWLLYDNQNDPYQLDNLCDKPEHTGLQKKLDDILTKKLSETSDQFLPAPQYIKKWGYIVDKTETIPFR